MKIKTVLVTGASGKIGKQLVSALGYAGIVGFTGDEK